MKNIRKTYAINGWFLTQRITGIQRYAYEIVRELDKLIGKNEVEIVVPVGTKVPEYENLKVVETGKPRGIVWEQSDYAKYLKENDKLALCLCNVVPIRYPHGIATIHDISCKVNPEFFQTARGKASATWYKKIYKTVAKSDMKIVTVSEFSKNEISEVYGVDKSRITVAYSAWQHMDRITADEKTLKKYGLEEKKYFFAMATMMPNKNFKWIRETAKLNPEKTFAIAGLNVAGINKDNMEPNLKNLKLLGYVSDSEAKELMAKCEAFIMPTFYEGFGLPPLEAVASGADRIIISDLPVLHEVYGEDAEYVNPRCAEKMNPSETLNSVTGQSLKSGRMNTQRLLDKYSWKNSAEILREEISQ